MRKGQKIIWSIVGGIAALILGCCLFINHHIDRYITDRINHVFDHRENLSIHVGDVKVLLLTGEAFIEDLEIHIGTRSEEDETNEWVEEEEHTDILIDKIKIGRIPYRRYLHEKVLEVETIKIEHPTISHYIDEKPMPKNAAQAEARRIEINQKSKEHTDSVAAIVAEHLHALSIQRLEITDAETHIYSLSSKMQVDVDSIDITLYDLGYDLLDSLPYHFNHERYAMSIRAVSFTTPNGLMAIRARQITNEDGGAISIGQSEIHHLVQPWELANYLEPGPHNWINANIAHIQTSNFNILKQAEAKDLELDTIDVRINKLHTFADLRLKSQHTLPMPQEGLLAMKYPFLVKVVNTNIKNLRSEVAMTDRNCGLIQMNSVKATIRNITNKRGEDIQLHLYTNLYGGKADIEGRFCVNKRCQWNIHASLKDADIHQMEELTFPLIGIRVGGKLNQLTTHYHGDRETAHGEFCMIYDGLRVSIAPNPNSAFDVVNKYYGLINSLAKTFIPKSNPQRPNMLPNRFTIEWTRDPYRPAPAFIVGPLINGMIKTFLPGLYLKSRIKEGKNQHTTTSKTTTTKKPNNRKKNERREEK